MGHVRGSGNPFAQRAICRVGDGDCVRQAWLSSLSRYVAAFDPVIDDMHADTVPLTNFIDAERSGWPRGGRDTMLEADPAYHAGSEGFAS